MMLSPKGIKSNKAPNKKPPKKQGAFLKRSKLDIEVRHIAAKYVA
jgi:hypothetical protein